MCPLSLRCIFHKKFTSFSYTIKFERIIGWKYLSTARNIKNQKKIIQRVLTQSAVLFQKGTFGAIVNEEKEHGADMTRVRKRIITAQTAVHAIVSFLIKLFLLVFFNRFLIIPSCKRKPKK